VGADACIKEAVGENNSEHFFVASQDTDLRKKLQEVCIIYYLFEKLIPMVTYVSYFSICLL